MYVRSLSLILFEAFGQNMFSVNFSISVGDEGDWSGRVEHVFWVVFFIIKGRGLTKVIPILVFQWSP